MLNTAKAKLTADQQKLKFRIQHLTEHVKKSHNDLSTKRALVNLVGKRRRLLDYLKDRDIERYRVLIKQLGIRK